MTKPLRFPIKFKVVLRLVIGGRLHGDRLHVFRKFWCAQLKFFEDVECVPTEDKSDEGRLKKANDTIERFTLNGVDEHWFNIISTDLPKWRKACRIQQRRDAANKRWQKGKPLDGEKNRKSDFSHSASCSFVWMKSWKT